MGNLERAAAMIAAAVIIQTGKDTQPKAAARRYFNCLAALHDESKDRETTGHRKEANSRTPEEVKWYIEDVFGDSGRDGGGKDTA